MTMTLISTVTVGSGGAANIDFTSIPATYTDLFLVVSSRSSHSAAQDPLFFRVNNSTSGYSGRGLEGTGSSAGSGSTQVYLNWLRIAEYINGNTSTSNTFSSTSLYIPNYAGSTNKSISVDTVMEQNATLGSQQIVAALWSNTAAITQLTFTTLNGGSFVQYSTASLYGILKGSGGATVS